MVAKRFLTKVFVLSAVPMLVLGPVATCDACFSIVVGKGASVDGHVIVAHNEDDGAPQVVNHHKVLRKKYSPGDKVTLRNGGQLDQVPRRSIGSGPTNLGLHLVGNARHALLRQLYQ